jgi:hypothetical protein
MIVLDDSVQYYIATDSRYDTYNSAKLLTAASGSYKYSLGFWAKFDSAAADAEMLLCHATALDTPNSFDPSV